MTLKRKLFIQWPAALHKLMINKNILLLDQFNYFKTNKEYFCYRCLNEWIPKKKATRYKRNYYLTFLKYHNKILLLQSLNKLL